MIELYAWWPLEIIRLGVRGQGWPWKTPPVLQSATLQVTAPYRLHRNTSFTLEINTARCPTKAPPHLRNGAISNKCRLLLLLFLAGVRVRDILALGQWDKMLQPNQWINPLHGILTFFFLWLSCGGYRGNAEGKGHWRVLTRSLMCQDKICMHRHKPNTWWIFR